MNSKMTALVAVIAVAVVVVAGAVVITTNNKSSSSYEAGASHLQIRGNVNDDTTIDSKDMEILEKVISEEYKLTDYPLADVNGDGKADDTDKQHLQDLIDRKEGCSAFVICLDREGKTTFQEITYPLRDVVTYGTNAQLPTLYANGGQYMAGYFKSSYATAESSISPSAVDLKGDARAIPTAAWANFTKLDSDLTNGIGAFIVDYSGISAISDSYAEDITAGKIPFLIFSSADATSEITTVLTLGFLFGGDCEQMGLNYAKTSWDVINKIGQDVSGIADKDKTTFIGCTMYIYICQNDSTFASSGVIAGGMPYYKTNSSFAEAYKGANSVKMASVEALSNYKDIGRILNTRSIDFGLDPSEVKEAIIGTWDHDNAGISSKEYFKGFDSKLTYIDNIMPGAVKVAYMAHALYSGKFSIDYANGVLLQFINLGTLPLKGQTLDTIVPFIDKAVYDGAVSQTTVSVGDNALDMANSLYKNYTGKYKTGASDAAYSFANGSNGTSATLSVANTNTDPEQNLNTIKVTVASDAKTAYTNRYAEYAGLVSPESGYAAVNLSSDFYGAYACYKNDAGVGIAHITGYIQEVMFDCYLYEDYSITEADLQGLVTALYSAVTNPVVYDGTPIPEANSSGAKLVAETLAHNDSKWAVSNLEEATTESATVDLNGKNAMGNAAVFHIPIKSGYSLSASYDTMSAAVDERLDELVSSKGSSTQKYVAYTKSVEGVELHAVYGHIESKTYTYLYFVMKCGNILVDGTTAKVCLTNETESQLPADVDAFFEELASAVKSSAESGAELVANALVANNSAWSIPSDATVTSASASVVLAGKGAMGSAKDYTLPIQCKDGADADYTTMSAAVDERLDELVSSKGSSTQKYVAYTKSVEGVDLHAVYGHIANKDYTYVYFVMKCGNTIIDGTDAKVCFYRQGDEAQQSADVDAFFEELATAMKA